MDSTRDLGPCLGNDLPLPLFRHHLQPGLNRQRKHTANTRVFYWGKRLMAMWEGGQPFKLDPLALSTEGRSRLGGAILKEDDPFGSQMVYDSKQDRALFYAVTVGAKQSELCVYEFDSKFRLVDRSVTELAGCAVLNDFAATENYAVFVQPNIAVNSMKFIMSKEPGAVLSLEENEPATLHLIPRVGANVEAKSFSIPVDTLSSDANLQFCNAYQEGDTVVVVDAIRSDAKSLKKDSKLSWPWGKSLEEYRSAASRKSLWRYTIDTQTGSVSKRVLYSGHCLFGVVNPAVRTQRHQYIYMTIGATGTDAAPPQGIAAVDCDTGDANVWMPEPYEFCGEPMYAPRQGQEMSPDDSGYLLSVLYNGKTQESEVVVLEARDVSKGPLARIPLGVAVPHGLFGCFTTAEEASRPFDEIQRRAKLADKMESRGNNWNEVKSDFSGLGLRFDGKSRLCEKYLHVIV
jgi:all-trans-8'-apo-beta-carotenal 15,15'-oxygenase